MVCKSYISEHPEDLGASVNLRGQPVFPASIWQLAEFWALAETPNWITVAFFQCRFQVDRLKPTRLLSNIPALLHLGISGPPIFDSHGFYQGPLPQSSACSSTDLEILLGGRGYFARTATSGVPRPGGEIFRVDAKADAGVVCIGGWESSFDGCPPNKARWFSLRLTRTNAPWIYVRVNLLRSCLPWSSWP